MNDNYRRYDRTEFDVDTGTYLEDVHSNDFIGLDKDANGLIDNVEELIEDADERAKEYNKEQERISQEQIDKEEEEDKEDKNNFAFDM